MDNNNVENLENMTDEQILEAMEKEEALKRSGNIDTNAGDDGSDNTDTNDTGDGSDTNDTGDGSDTNAGDEVLDNTDTNDTGDGSDTNTDEDEDDDDDDDDNFFKYVKECLENDENSKKDITILKSLLLFKSFTNTSNIDLKDHYEVYHVDGNNFSKTEMISGEDVVEGLVSKKYAIYKMLNEKRARSMINVICNTTETSKRKLTLEQKYNCCFLLAKSHNMDILSDLYKYI